MKAFSPKQSLSIITVCFNSALTIRSTIASVLCQDYKNFEYIIIDGGSLDDTVKIINEFKDHRIQLISKIDEGLWDAMNKGVDIASGRYVTFLNSDDVYKDKHVITNSLYFIDENCLDLMFGFVDIYDEDLMKIIREYRVKELSLNLLKVGVMPAHPGSIIKRSFFKKLGGFHYNLDVPPDFYMLMSALLTKKARIKCLPKVLVNMRSGGLGNSSIKYKLDRQFRIINSLKLAGINVSIFKLLISKILYRRKEFFVEKL